MKRYAMVQGHKARYSLKYYFVWEGLIYLKYNDIERFIDDNLKCKCVDIVAY